MNDNQFIQALREDGQELIATVKLADLEQQWAATTHARHRSSAEA